MVGAVFQPWLAWGIPALETTGYWVVPSVGKKMAAFKRPRRTPQNCCHQCLCLCSEPEPSRASVRDPPLLPGRLAPSLLSHCFLPWVPVCETLCVPSMSRVCFPQLCRITLVKPHLSSKPYSLRAPSPVTGPPGWDPDMGLRTFPPVGDPLWYNYFPVRRSPTWHVWDLILWWLCPLLANHCGFFLSLDVGYLRLIEASISGVWQGSGKDNSYNLKSNANILSVKGNHRLCAVSSKLGNTILLYDQKE